MTCCVIGRHPDAADIDRAIRAQQAAARANESTRAPSYSQIARTYGLRKATLLDHRDRCLAANADRGADRSGVPVRSEGVPVRTAAVSDDENANDSARSDRYGTSVPARDADDVGERAGRATGPPGNGTDRRTLSQSAAPDAAQSAPRRVAQRDADVAVDESSGESRSVGVGAPTTTDPSALRARARERGKAGWSKVVDNAVEQAVQSLASAAHDVAITDSSVRAHGSYVEEIAQIVQNGEWEDEKTVQRLTRAWQKSRLFVLQCHRDACTLIRVARGTRFEQIESAVARWMRIFNTAMGSDSPEAQRVAAEAAKGIDRVLGLVDAGTKVQVNILQDDGAQLLLRIVLEELADLPDRMARVRRRLTEARDKLGDPTAILTTGAEVDAAE